MTASAKKLLDGDASVNTFGTFVNINKVYPPLACGNTVPEVGLEPTLPKKLHFECSASANSATRAYPRAL